MNLLQTAATWLGSQLKLAAGQTVTYNGVSKTAVVAQHEYEVINQKAGTFTSLLSYDWTFTAADLPSSPVSGDLIVSALGTFQVLPVGNRPAFEWLDSSGVLLLVHSKKVA